ncbi:MAG TPA: hypothetical protein VG079_01690 [Gaiellaceae bacterium]|nr:hypothetical protein [Gaiellaceae bacterium]
MTEFLVIVALVAAGVAFFALRARRRESGELAAVRGEAADDLLELGEDIRALDLDVQARDLDAATRGDYERALEAYERADRALKTARHPDDLEKVSAALEEGRFAIASTRARIEGRELPERRPPCFFDPRHGPSVRDVEWAPPGGTARAVPACAADAQRIEEGQDPDTREFVVGGRRVPHWDAPPAYGPYAGGFFSPFGFLPGLLIGSMLMPPVVIDEGGGSGDEGGDGGDGGEGEAAEGDLGDGGDFGGGDFGGGDF